MASALSISTAQASIPATAGIGLRSRHYREILATKPSVGWLEVHSENYLGKGGAPLHWLEQLRMEYPISLHGVSLSLGSTDTLDWGYLDRLKALIERVNPGLVSEHLSWNSSGGRFLNDLAPVPYTDATLSHLVSRINAVQAFLGRRILIENPSSYLEFKQSTYCEYEFLNALARHSGCGILLDLNNVYVSSRNHGWNALEYIQGIAGDCVEELHLAGHTLNQINGRSLWIDTHNRPVCDDVWALLKHALALFGPKPVLIEWDSELPQLAVLTAEAEKASALIGGWHE